MGARFGCRLGVEAAVQPGFVRWLPSTKIFLAFSLLVQYGILGAMVDWTIW
jgi:hypothetical protein